MNAVRLETDVAAEQMVQTIGALVDRAPRPLDGGDGYVGAWPVVGPGSEFLGAAGTRPRRRLLGGLGSGKGSAPLCVVAGNERASTQVGIGLERIFWTLEG